MQVKHLFFMKVTRISLREEESTTHMHQSYILVTLFRFCSDALCGVVVFSNSYM